jgi:predicted nucleic acid-binding Zn ribbon protein
MEGVEDMVKKPEGAAHISGILSGLLNSFRPETEQGMLRIWRVWDRSVGKDIAGNARPAAFKGSVLLVHVTSSSWLHHLRFLKKDLVARLNDDLGQPLVSDIKFKIGSF